jgi:hypothetical protein
MTIEQISEFYEGTGWNKSDLIKYLKSKCTKGYSLSYDGSMGYFHFEDFNVLVAPCALEYILNIK